MLGGVHAAFSESSESSGFSESSESSESSEFSEFSESSVSSEFSRGGQRERGPVEARALLRGLPGRARPAARRGGPGGHRAGARRVAEHLRGPVPVGRRAGQLLQAAPGLRGQIRRGAEDPGKARAAASAREDHPEVLRRGDERAEAEPPGAGDRDHLPPDQAGVLHEGLHFEAVNQVVRDRPRPARGAAGTQLRAPRAPAGVLGVQGPGAAAGPAGAGPAARDPAPGARLLRGPGARHAADEPEAPGGAGVQDLHRGGHQQERDDGLRRVPADTADPGARHLTDRVLNVVSLGRDDIGKKIFF